MALVKISSNPYIKQTDFHVFDSASKEWLPVNEYSSLLSEDLTHGFFPFKVQEIVDAICNEFGSSEPVEILFEGCDDEYAELEQVCGFDEYRGCVKLSRSSLWLENARDILPQVIDVFRTLRPFFEDNVPNRGRISEDLRKFTEASDDVIPICVLGNYSAGKSTFINALIGQELLPSGDAPSTARVFQISCSKQPDRASITFSLSNQRVSLRYDDKGVRPITMWEDLPLVAAIKESLAGSSLGLVASMNRTLELINYAERHGFKDPISDLVNIEVPFNGDGALARLGKFVIFDTPGSNSATNAEHNRILQEAMGSFSNGLPVYVCEYSSLDSTDNQKLYDEIKQIEALDERFTIIVVNKADAASLPRDGLSDREKEDILNEAVPRSMYAQGIYFVSSIMGLGSKTGGEFENDFYAEKYEDQERKYTDPSARFYKRLYSYDIMPEQIRRRVVDRSAGAANLMLANSGLLSVEDAMGVFATRYSSFNKCHQSEVLLKHLIDITSEEVEIAKGKREKDREIRTRALEHDKSVLIDKLDELVARRRAEAIDGYHPTLDDFVQSTCPTVDAETLNGRQDALVACHREERSVDVVRRDEADRVNDIGKNLADNAQSLVSAFDFNKMADMFSNLTGDIGKAIDAHTKVDDVMRECDRAAASDLFNEVKDEFVERATETLHTVEERSRAYWDKVSEASRAELYRFVTESDYLDGEKRATLGKTIEAYHGLLFEDMVNTVFNEDRLRGLWLWDFRLLDSDRLNVDTTAELFNRSMRESIMRAYEEVAKSHSCDFDVWLTALQTELVDNIVDFNPGLRDQDDLIRTDAQKIAELESGMRMLDSYENQVRQMIGWKGEGASHGYC